MLKDLRIGWRQLVGDPGYSAVILLGLSVAIACCHLVAQVVFNELLPDPDVPDPAQVVNIEFRGNIPDHPDDWYPQAPFVFGTTLRQAGAPVSAITRSLDGLEFVVHAGERSARVDLEFADPDFVDVFGLRASAGDVRAAFARPDTIALTERVARQLFPAGDAIGKAVRVHGQALTVVALVAPRTRDVAGVHDAYVSFESKVNPMGADDRTEWYSISGSVFARVAKGFKAEDVGAAAQALFDNGPGARSVPAPWTAHGRKGAFLRAMPLTRRYLEGARDGHANLMLLLSMGGGAALMLGLAIANYINLTSVRTLARSREIAVRKTLGVSPWRLTAQFVFESGLAAVVATAFGLLLAWWVAPTIGGLLGLSLADGLFSPARLALLTLAALGLGVVTGLYPARIALSVNCSAALSGRSHDEGAVGRALRRAMTALQFAVALVIAASASAMLWQSHYVATLRHGIRIAGLLSLDMPERFSGKSTDVNEAFREALSHQPGVDAMTWSMDVPGRGEAWLGDNVGRVHGGPSVRVKGMRVDAGFFDVYGVNIVAGRPRAPAAAPSDDAASAAPKPERLVVIDETASRSLGFASPQAAVDQVILGDGNDRAPTAEPMRVVAVAGDIRLESAREPVQAHMFLLSRKSQGTLTLQGAHMEALQQAVARLWPRYFPEDSLDTTTVEEALGLPYLRELRLAQMATVTTVLALLLAAFGVYALAAYTVRRSAREIVVRKLYGAGRARIAGLMAREFAPLLGVAAMVGLPIAGWLAHAWLSNFVERSPGAFWALPAALLVLVAMTSLAALRHVLIAMNMRPVQALRD